MEPTLKCPYCESDQLRQKGTEIWEREEEDSTRGFYIAADRHRIVIDKDDQGGNPSPRRHGLQILFDCEGCGGMPILAIYQHKGQTLLEWK